MGDARRTRAWRRLRVRVIEEEPACWLRRPGCTYWSTTADHVKPYATHPHLALERSNIRGACEHCNKSRQATPVDTPTESVALALFDD